MKSSMTPINVQLSSMTPINANQRKISCGRHSWSTLSNIGFTKYVHLRPRHAECRRCGRYIWGTFRFRKMGRKFLQGKQLLLWSGFTGTAFYISIRYVAFLKKIKFFSAVYRDKAGSRVQGKAMTVRVNEEELLVRYLVI